MEVCTNSTEMISWRITFVYIPHRTPTFSPTNLWASANFMEKTFTNVNHSSKNSHQTSPFGFWHEIHQKKNIKNSSLLTVRREIFTEICFYFLHIRVSSKAAFAPPRKPRWCIANELLFCQRALDSSDARRSKKSFFSRSASQQSLTCPKRGFLRKSILFLCSSAAAAIVICTMW